MKRGLFLIGATLTVAVTSVLMWGKTEPAEASIQYVYETHTQPVEVPYLDMDLEHLKCVMAYRQAHTDAPESTETAEMECNAELAENTPEWTYYGECRITHYDDCAECCGIAGNTTASGVYPTPHHTVAAGEDLPFGTEVLINGEVYVVEDRGVDCGEIDIFVEDHQTALNMGLYYTEVYIRWQDQD